MRMMLPEKLSALFALSVDLVFHFNNEVIDLEFFTFSNNTSVF